MMLKSFFGITILSVVLIACDKKQADKINDTAATEMKSSDLPAMDVELVDGTRISVKDVNQKAVLILFQPDCEDCQREALEIRKNLTAFTGYQLYFISSHSLAEIKEFGIKYDLSTQPDVLLGRTTIESVLNNFGAIAAPSVYIFDSSGKMTAKFNGEVAVEKIIQSL